MAEPTILLCVGAQKAGTTWLYGHLRDHPDCHLRAVKELHYFDGIDVQIVPRMIAKTTERAAAIAGQMADAGPEEADRLAREHRDLTDWLAVLARKGEDIPAYLAYLAEGRGTRRLVADITPSYATLSEARLRGMAGMAPDVRFLFVMRDPVERLWSQVRMRARTDEARAEAVPAKAMSLMKDVLARKMHWKFDRTDYIGAITRLRAVVDPSRLMFMFYEDLLSEPGMTRLAAFLGIAPHPANFGIRPNEGLALPLPEDMRRAAARFLRPHYEFVARQFPALPQSWQRNMEVMA